MMNSLGGDNHYKSNRQQFSIKARPELLQAYQAVSGKLMLSEAWSAMVL